MISVALVEDEPGTRGRLERAILAHDHLQLLYSCARAGEMLSWLPDHSVNVLLVDLGLPDGSGIDVIRQCQQLQPACEIMVVTMFGDEANMLKAFGAGARGYLLKDGTEEDLAVHILNLSNGGSPMSPIIARQLLMRLAPPQQTTEATAGTAMGTSVPLLSPKESEVLALVARGFSYPETANLLGISVHTVHSHVRNIYGKLSVNSKTEAIYEARQLGLLGP